jgi:hypothetical protein
MAFSSPKRKRSEDHQSSPIKVPALSTRFPIVKSDLPSEDEGSPRTQVAGHFQGLKISSRSQEPQSPEEPPSKRPHYSDDEITESSQESARPPSPCQQQLTASNPKEQYQTPDPPSSSAFTFQRAMSTVFPQGEAPRPKSPSLKGEVSDQYWHESEITGHNPDDPDDDGYGINGIGFKPTSAMAYARTQKRKQQITEYRNREAKEQRQKRSERRKGASIEVKTESPPDTPSKSRVRFEAIG